MELHYTDLRKDWYANGTFMSRAIQRQLRARRQLILFVGFPRHWLPLFEWSRCPWRGSVEPDTFVPFMSGRTEDEVVADIERAKSAKRLRLLVDVAASSEVVLSETLQRLDGRLGELDFTEESGQEIRLTTWHSYNRADVRAFDLLISDFKQRHKGVLFIPCSKARPYSASQSHRRLLQLARAHEVPVDLLDKVVITSLGPVPEQYWNAGIVQVYDTGIRDIYRLFLQTKVLLKGTNYTEAWDLMSFAPYSDMLHLCHLEGLLPTPKRLSAIRKRNISVYRPEAAVGK
jgi:hypothetical protein